VKADVQGFPKMWYFSKFGDFKLELWLLKVGSNLKIFLGRLAAFKKKDTATIFQISVPY